MAARFGLFVFVILLSLPIHRDSRSELVIWNVGQGLWSTVIEDGRCWHFDAGGEFAPWSALVKACRRKRNFLSISHWDWDHMSFVRRFPSHFPNACRTNTPLGPGSPSKLSALRRIHPCSFALPFNYWENEKSKTTNGRSRVVFWKGIVFPGDSPRAEEKHWALDLAGIKQTKILILGHHGSRTSTSGFLLRRLPDLKLAIVSSRFRRYGHPHPDVLNELERFHIAVISTEDWGNIHIGL